MKFEDSIEENVSSILGLNPAQSQVTAPKPKRLNAQSARAAEVKSLNTPMKPIRAYDLKKKVMSRDEEEKMGSMVSNLKYALALSANTKFASYASSKIGPIIQYLETEAQK